MAIPVIDAEKCVGCAACESSCPTEAIKVGDDAIAAIDAGACVECMACIDSCPTEAISES
ncbi:MAG: 4Fe-4S binding protein [Proteobacteria bacterium]|nr:4Fe-4S binding protein [Pseudomonadota bacterium]